MAATATSATTIMYSVIPCPRCPYRRFCTLLSWHIVSIAVWMQAGLGTIRRYRVGQNQQGPTCHPRYLASRYVNATQRGNWRCHENSATVIFQTCELRLRGKTMTHAIDTALLWFSAISCG